jgi:hypothetical protein
MASRPARDSDEANRHQRTNSTNSQSGRKSVPSKGRRPSGGATNNPRPQVSQGSEASMHAPQRKVSSEGAPPASLPAKPTAAAAAANAASSTLNPNAGGFHPGGLSALHEVQREELVSKWQSNVSAVLCLIWEKPLRSALSTSTNLNP